MTEKKVEFANALTHGLGALFFIAASPLLIFFSIQKGDLPMAYINVGYLFCLLVTYFSSTLYHAVTEPYFKKSMRVMDHISIFLLIGGTFTPLAFKYMEGRVLLVVFWSVILIGVLFKVFFTGRFKFLSTFFYLAIAWVTAMFSGEMFENMPQRGFQLLLAGGISYSTGTVFYMWKKLTYHHAIWHVFVFVGSVLHFFAVLEAVVV